MGSQLGFCFDLEKEIKICLQVMPFLKAYVLQKLTNDFYKVIHTNYTNVQTDILFLRSPDVGQISLHCIEHNGQQKKKKVNRKLCSIHYMPTTAYE